LITSQAGHQPVDFTDVRATNLALVLAFVRANAPCSRADIAASTGLNKATVSSLVAELMERRLVREIGRTENRLGRPATMFVLDGAAYAAVGLEVNTDHLTVVAIDLAGERLLSWRRAFAGRSTPPAKAVATVAALVRKAVAKVQSEERRVLGVTVGVAGLVDSGGVVRFAPNLGWTDVALQEALVKALETPDFPVTVENEANLAAQAEYRYGPHLDVANMIYIAGHAGLGAGIIADGRLLRGGAGYSGEVGHVVVDPRGPACACGRRGCLEAVAGIGALVRRVGGDETGDLEAEIEDLVRGARAREAAVLDALKKTGRLLGQGLSVLSNVLNPQLIVLGGYFVSLAPWITSVVEEELLERTAAPEAGGCRIAISALGHGAAATGGAASVLDKVDAGHLP
jgi:predicted NBD/HSP70 family sugar kinase